MSKQLDVIDRAYSDIDTLYKQRMSENPLHKSYAQGMMTQFADSLREANGQNAAMAAVGGGVTAEQLAAQKAANAQALGSAASAISQNAEAQQQAYDQMKVGATQNLAAQKVQTLDKEQERKAALWGAAISGAAGIAAGAMGNASIWRK